MTQERISIVIVEDEIMASRRLKKLLKKFDKIKITIICEIDTGEELINWMNTNSMPDLLFLDIELGDGNIFETLKNQNISCPIIFTTAFQEYAFNAFALNTIDYLLKPIEQKPLFFSLEKFIQKKNIIENDIQYKSIRDMINGIGAKSYRENFLVQNRTKKKLISVENISFFSINNGVIYANLGSAKQYIVSEPTLDLLETLLNPVHFFRANRQFIISKSAINEIEMNSTGKISLTIKNYGVFSINISKERATQFRKWVIN